MGAPQIIIIVLFFLEFFLVAANHGESKGDYDIGEWLVGNLIIFGILFWGGFFDPRPASVPPKDCPPTTIVLKGDVKLRTE